jgi:hypothetical protein
MKELPQVKKRSKKRKTAARIIMDYLDEMVAAFDSGPLRSDGKNMAIELLERLQHHRWVIIDQDDEATDYEKDKRSEW